jgi:very-short-patch-repair endonuclease
MSGTSKEEIAIREVLAAKYGFDPVEGKIVTPGRVWRVDALHTTKKFVVEFDGEYWHGDDFPDKRGTDIRKTRELLDAGYRVLRVRHNLPNLKVLGANSMRLHHHQVFDLDNLAQRVEERVGKLLL